MNDTPQQISLEDWDERYALLHGKGLNEPYYGGPLGRHFADGGDLRLKRLKYDNSTQALDLWNFLLTEEDRLRAARTNGNKIVGTMKDLGTIPVLAYSFQHITAFYPDGAWWIPCVMEMNAGLLSIADSLGIDDSFCPVRAMLGAFATEAHFPIPDLLTCSVGAVCDDFSAIAQRLNGMGHPILWWEMPHRRAPQQGESAVELPGGLSATRSQVDLVQSEIARVSEAMQRLTGEEMNDAKLSKGIEIANQIRSCLNMLRHAVFTAPISPLPALELLIAEMLAIHFCSDRAEALRVLTQLLELVKLRIAAGQGFSDEQAVRIFWVNPVADLRVMNLLEECHSRICGTEYLFSHALDPIPTNVPPMEALARSALADPMVGPAEDRAQRICRDAQTFGSEAVVFSRIPGASHCALEGESIANMVRNQLSIPIVEIEVPPISDALEPAIRTRLEALAETALGLRKQNRTAAAPKAHHKGNEHSSMANKRGT